MSACLCITQTSQVLSDRQGAVILQVFLCPRIEAVPSSPQSQRKEVRLNAFYEVSIEEKANWNRIVSEGSFWF